MTRKVFGTDGIRGEANTGNMTAEFALKVAMAAAAHFRRGEHRHRVVIAKDTRLSGYMLEPALTAGFISMGMDVLMVGPMPTPSVAMLVKSMRADLGVMISASHNPYTDNGIKLFGPDGFKLSDEIEAEIEQRIADNGFMADLTPSAQLGRAERMEDARGRYIEYVKSSFPTRLSLDGMKIVVDCAHGAAYRIAGRVLSELGAEVIEIGTKPNGTNINAGVGAVHTEAMQERVVAEGADLGIALDGDADRLVMADENGRRIDGDQLMALIARDWAKRGQLKGGGMVATVMSNLGLERFMKILDLNLLRTPVGDCYVMEAMRRHGYNIGGEQSGHIILTDYGTTGDGLLAALQCLAVIARSDRPVSEVTRVFEPVPQILQNVRYDASMGSPLENATIQQAISDVEHDLEAKGGRLLVRASGTEPVIRVMAEGDDEAQIKAVVNGLCAMIEGDQTSKVGSKSEH
ncbi:MAG: phosphoglucosamine mutase [Alphaproteobacteria bacterium]